MSNTRSLLTSVEQRSKNAKHRTMTVLKELQEINAPISVASVAKHAQVSRTFIYNHRELLEKIRLLQANDNSGIKTSSSTISDLKEVEIRRLRHQILEQEKLLQRIKELECENNQLKQQLRTAYKF